MKRLVKEALDEYERKPGAPQPRVNLIGRPSFDAATIKELVKQPRATFK
jgi:hypothetical protein